MNRKVILSIITIIVISIAIFGYRYYQKVFGKAVTKDGIVFIHTNDNIGNLKKELIEFIGDKNHFDWVAEKKKFTKPKPGRYRLKKGMSLNDLINLLRSGNQEPIKVSFNNQDTLEKLAQRIAVQIEADSASLVHAFKDSVFLTSNGLNKKTVLEIFVPNSYEFYWNTSGVKFRDRMLKEYNRFWNQDRIQKAKALGFSKSQVMTLASIVQKETSKPIERPTVAGLYINRIKKGIPLQADPTIIYALKEKNGEDFIVKRVLTKDLKIKSPYNTYRNRGLPPSLIAMPDISSIDAVLNYEKHNYLYMCASVEKLGYHAFASTLKQHNRNASKYQRWLNKQGVMR